MRGERHQSKGLQYLTVLPDGYNPELRYPLVIMLHGFGANMQDLGYGQVGYGWTAPREQTTPEEVQNAETLLAGFFGEVLEQFQVAPGRSLLLGFSQGGGMTYRCGFSRAETFAGLVALSASLPSPKELEDRLPRDRTQPIFVAHGRADPLVSAESAEKVRLFLEEAGYSPEYHIYDMAHEISGEVLRDLIPWIARVLPPLE